MPKDKGYSYGSSKMDRKNNYMSNDGVMGHDSKPYHINVLAAQKRDNGRINQLPMEYRGTPEQAFDYKY